MLKKNITLPIDGFTQKHGSVNKFKDYYYRFYSGVFWVPIFNGGDRKT